MTLPRQGIVWQFPEGYLLQVSIFFYLSAELPFAKSKRWCLECFSDDSSKVLVRQTESMGIQGAGRTFQFILFTFGFRTTPGNTPFLLPRMGVLAYFQAQGFSLSSQRLCSFSRGFFVSKCKEFDLPKT